MKSEIEIFLRAFFAGMQGKKIELSDEEMKETLKYAMSNNVVPIVYAGVKKPTQATDTYAVLRKQTLSECSRQAVMNDILSRFIKKLGDIPYRILKGPVVAKYYPSPEMRTSSDVDVLLPLQNMDKVKDIVKEMNGQILEKLSDDNCTHAIIEKFLHLELHTTLFENSEAAYEKDFSFDNIFKPENLEQTELEGLNVVTLKPQLHLLYLLCHSATHFVNAGCGIRQLADCWLYASKNIDKMDIEWVLRKAEQYSLLTFTKTVFSIGIRYCGANEKILPLAIEKELCEILLEDCVEGGSFGRSSAERAATTTVTRKKNMALVGSLFPPKEYLKKRYPDSSLFIAWLRRIVDFLKKGDNPVKTVKQTLSIAKDRMTLIDEMKIYARSSGVLEQQTLDDIEKNIKAADKVRVEIVGDSMRPFLKPDRDYVVLEKLCTDLKKGDIYFYRRSNGQPVMHRLMAEKGDRLVMCGDSQLVCEEIGKETVFAIATEFEINGKTVGRKSLKYLFYSRVWSLIPLRKFAYKVLSLWKKIKGSI